MNRSFVVYAGLAAVIAITFFIQIVSPALSQGTKEKKPSKQAARGQYLVTVAGCHDCHSPKIMTERGPKIDSTRLLSGHPAETALPEIPMDAIAPDQWGGVFSNDLTAWSGPWGTTFTRNLTPDSATGLGSWTDKIFIKAIRTGKDMGEGRDILPPMPWEMYAQMTDEDLRAIFAYLRTIPPVENAVPDPIAPTGERLPTLNRAGDR